MPWWRERRGYHEEDRHYDCKGSSVSLVFPRHTRTNLQQIREVHRKYKEDGIGKRDILIVAHGHLSRCFISRWFGFELCLGMCHIALTYRLSTDVAASRDSFQRRASRSCALDLQSQQP